MSKKTEKTIRVLIEIPEKWVDFDSPLGLVSSTVRYMLERQIKEAVIEEYVKKVNLPKVKWTKEEIKIRILDKLAERAVDKFDEEKNT